MKLWSPKEQHLRKHVRTPEITCTLQDVGKSQFFDFENPIFKFQTFFKKTFSQDHSKLDSKLSPFPLAGSHRRHEGLGLLDTKFSTTTTAVVLQL